LGWLNYVYNNTYGLQMINDTVFNEFEKLVTDPHDGCIASFQQCRQLAEVGDPQFYANNQTVNDFCGSAAAQCISILTLASTYANRNNFDVAQIGPQSFPGYQHIAFFNQRWVQQALGVPLNFTDDSNLTTLYFVGDADPFRQNQSSIEYLLENNIQVALVYGDRDARCPWNGAENVSLTVDFPDAHNFRSAGYADIQTNGSHKGGVVRQYDGFSFSRVFEAGHAVSSFQPKTSLEIFNRVMFRRDIATGLKPAGYDLARGQRNHSEPPNGYISQSKHYQSQGLSSSWSIKNDLPPSPVPVCNLWAVGITCTDEQINAIANGTAETHNFLVTSPLP
jgi:hypothetical protein